MTRTLTLTWLVLLMLTAATGLMLQVLSTRWSGLELILVLFVMKFLLVSWFFLGLRRAHGAWKFLVLAFTCMIFLVLGLNT